MLSPRMLSGLSGKTHQEFSQFRRHEEANPGEAQAGGKCALLDEIPHATRGRDHPRSALSLRKTGASPLEPRLQQILPGGPNGEGCCKPDVPGRWAGHYEAGSSAGWYFVASDPARAIRKRPGRRRALVERVLSEPHPPSASVDVVHPESHNAFSPPCRHRRIEGVESLIERRVARDVAQRRREADDIDKHAEQYTEESSAAREVCR